MLRIGGGAAVVRDLLGMLQEAAALGQLQNADPVTVGGQGSSWTLHRCLREIIANRARDARVTLVSSSGINFGAFGESQSLNAVNALRINAGARGMGVVIAFHEIWENYASRDERNQRGRYGPAHARALAVDRDIATELTGREGGRVASVELGTNAAQGYVFDYQDYFVVLTTRPEQDWLTGRFDAVIRERDIIDDYTIEGFAAGTRVGQDNLGDVLAALRANPAATAQVAGQRTEAEDPGQAALRATAVRSAIVIALDPDGEEYADGSSVELARDARSPGTTLGALRAWTGPEEKIDAEPGASVLIEHPRLG